MATTITGYSVSLGLDASNYIRNSNLSGRETAKLRRDIDKARTPAENYERAIDRLDKALLAGAMSQRTYTRLLADVKRKHAAAGAAANGHANMMASLKRSVGTAAAGYLSFRAAVGVGTWAIKLAADAEQAQIAFKVLTKDVQVAEDLLTDLRGFAAATPFGQTEIIDAGRKLLAFGFTVDQVTPRLQMMGNISAATGTRIEELAEIVGKMRVQGRIMSEDLNQLTGRGINVLDGLADRLGVIPGEVKNMASQGKIAFEDLLAVMEELANNDFAGMLEEQAGSLNGQWSTLKDTINQTGKLLGELAEKETDGKSWLGRGTELTRKFNAGLEYLGGGIDDVAEKQKQADIELFESNRLVMEMRSNGGKLPEWKVRELRMAAKERRIAQREADVAARREKERVAVEKMAATEQQKMDERRKQNTSAIASLQGKLSDNIIDMASADYGESAMRRIKLAYDSVNAKQKKYIIDAVRQGESLETIMDIVNEDESRGANIKRQMIAKVAAQQDLMESVKREKEIREAIAKQEEAINGRREKALEREKRLREEIAKGPGSGLGDAQQFVAQQINDQLAQSVTIKPDTLDTQASAAESQELKRLQAELQQERQKQESMAARMQAPGNAKEGQQKTQQELAELNRKQGQAQTERQKQTELLTTISQNGFQRIR